MNVERSILLVEDNPSDVELTRRALAKGSLTLRLIVAEDGQEALDYLLGTGSHQGRDACKVPSLVLLDIKLPRVDGLTVLERVRSDPRTRRVPIVIMTSSNEHRDVSRGYDLGANGYIRKPVNFDRFAEVMEQLGLYWLVVNEPPPEVQLS
jgi:CheY-like chemotaxis protein